MAKKAAKAGGAEKKKAGTEQKEKVGTGNLTALADWVHDHLFEAHRGSFVEGGKLVVFDNGGVSHPWGVHELELALAWLRKKGYKVQGLGTCSGNHTWVVVADVEPDADDVPVHKMLWDAWGKVVETDDQASFDIHRALEYQTALGVILDRPPLPRSVLEVLSRS
jgi:hypothetical protein